MGQLSGVRSLEPFPGVGHTYAELEVVQFAWWTMSGTSISVYLLCPLSQKGIGRRLCLCLGDSCPPDKSSFQQCPLCVFGCLFRRIVWALVTGWGAFVIDAHGTLCFCTILGTDAASCVFCMTSWLRSTDKLLTSDSRSCHSLLMFCPCTQIGGMAHHSCSVKAFIEWAVEDDRCIGSKPEDPHVHAKVFRLCLVSSDEPRKNIKQGVHMITFNLEGSTWNHLCEKHNLGYL